MANYGPPAFSALILVHLVRGGEHLLIDLPDLGAEVIGYYLQLRDNIDQGADAAFQLKELIQHNDFSLFEDTIAALEVAAFVAYDVLGLIQAAFYLVECSLCILHTGV